LRVFDGVNKTLRKPLDGRQFSKMWNECWPALKSEIDAIHRSERPIAVSELQQERQRVRRLCGRIAGAWWERVRGQGLGFFLVQLDEHHNSVRLVEGCFYSEKAAMVARWSGTATRITEQSGRLEIQYLRQCRVPDRDGRDWFHGYADLDFEGESPEKGAGMFFDATLEDRLRMVPIEVALRRVHDATEINTMLAGAESDRSELVRRVIHRMG